MYKISVPIMNANTTKNDREKVLKEIKRFDANRVFLALGTYELDPDKRRIALEALADNCQFFKDHNFEVGAWIWTFWIHNNTTFRNMRSIKGTEIKKFMCPTDERFVAFATDYIKDIAECGVDIIQFDDDFRYGFLSDSPACLCDGHIAAINRITGEHSTRQELEKYITSGAKNKFRDAFLKANGDAFRSFAAAVRRAVDEVNPNIRISLCTCMSSWDIDGTNAKELATILAGGTKPLLRLIGAPYWAVKKSWGNSLQDVIELERMESSWTRAEGIEIMAEGDVYPRPRILCPAAYLEGFDTAIRASGCTDGILKYGIDYFSNIEYETGYAQFHERNRETYKAIDSLFGGKVPCGIRVYESMKKISNMVMPTKVNSDVNIEKLFFSKAAGTLAYNSIPTTYEGEGVCGIVFDENARNLPAEAFRKGLILDVAAAEILTERGIDVGIESIGDAVSGDCERFLEDGNRILTNGAISYPLKLRKSAEVLSVLDTASGTVPVSYRYENANRQRFLIINLNTRSMNDNLLKHYARGRQYAEQAAWLGGGALPAYVYGSPSLYIQCKQGDGALAVGLWNFFADTVFSPTVQLDKAYSAIRCINCEGHLDGNQAYLSDIPPFGFVAFEVKP
ncbi:MAG: hypothetical protein E7666_02535 [Ruminococcaceae bacterium]|nr:hypothetical protein [Oscillospiraceae bacterium]